MSSVEEGPVKGVINKGIQDLLEAKFGPDVWERVRERAGCDVPFFAVGADYPDQVSIDLVDAAAVETGLPPEQVLVEFGKHWVPHTGRESYPALFRLAGSTAREFLMNVSAIHARVTKNIPNAAPPSFEYEELPDGRLRIHYHSERPLCPALRGLILGVGDHFGEALEVEEVACSQRGDEHCTMEVTFP